MIILAAIAVIAARALTPIANDHRADFEKYASKLLQMPVNIQAVSVSWDRYQPEIDLTQVTLIDKTTHEPLLQLKRISLFFSFLRSIWQRSFVLDGITIEGVDVNLHETSSGDIVLQGFPSFGDTSKPYQKETKFIDTMEWLSNQPRIILENINITYLGFTQQLRRITLHKLSLDNDGNRHTIVGKAVLHQSIPTKVAINVQWQGKHFDFATINSSIYLYVSGLSLSQWLDNYSWRNWQIKQGVASAKIWAYWQQGEFKKIQTKVQIYDTELYSNTDKSTHIINRLSGNIGWYKRDDQQIIAGDDLLIDLPSHLWPVTDFKVVIVKKSPLKIDSSVIPSTLSANAENKNNIAIAPPTNYVPKRIHIRYLDLYDVQSFLISSPPLLAQDVQQSLINLQLQGAVENLNIKIPEGFTDWKQITCNIGLNRISFVSFKSFPGFTNLTGKLNWNGKQGTLSLQTKNATLQYPSLFAHVIRINQLTGDIGLQYTDTHVWQIELNPVQLFNDDLLANASGHITIAENKSPYLDLKANLSTPLISHIKRYMPMVAFDPALVIWLSNAFIAGEIPAANAVLHGSLDAFPYDNHEGEFLVTTNVKNVELNFAPEWPHVKRINGKVIFSGRQMNIKIDSAETLGLPIQALQAQIPYFGNDKPQILYVQTPPIHADFMQGLEYVHKSPLEKTLGKMFSGMALHGPITLQLSLTVPLKLPENTTVKGSIVMQHASLNLVPWQLAVDDLNGSLNFTENSATASDIQGLLFNKPFTLNLNTQQQSKDSNIIKAHIVTPLNVDDLEKWLQLPLQNVVTGAALFDVNIDLSLKAPLVVSLHSQLEGIAIKLDAPYGKAASDSHNFDMNIIVAEKQPLQMTMAYANRISAALILNRKKNKFDLISVNLHLGGSTPQVIKQPGLYITGDIDQLDWDTIKKYRDQSSQNNPTKLVLRNIDIHTKVLKLFGQKITQAHLQVTPASSHWNVNITSNEIVGQVQVPTNFNRSSQINAEFDKLNLYPVSSNDSTSTISSIDMNNLPTIYFTARSFAYNNMTFGKIILHTSSSAHGLNINSLQLTSPYISLEATGNWAPTNMTHLVGSAKSNEVSGFLTNLGIDAHNLIVNKGHLKFNLNWHGAPFAPSLAGLNGDASIELGAGRIIDVGDTSEAKMGLGRMLSIFSLQTIPRRLSFDFSDLFQKGYSFDSVRGNFNFKNGSAFTNNSRFDGPVARVGIDGRIGLKNKDYDFTLSVTPYVTASAPLAATLLTGNPLVGVAVFAVNKVVGSAVSQVTTYYYAVRGPWNNPTWQSISGKAT